jgi:hypothetical protein
MLTSMRVLAIPFLVALCLAPAVLRAGEGADAVTARLPKESEFLVRLPSLDRLDAVGKEVLPLIRTFLPEAAASALDEMTLSELVVGQAGVDPRLLDRSKPIYLGRVGEGAVVLTTAAEGAVLEGDQEVAAGMVARIVDGILCVLPEGDAAELRGEPTALLDGDLAVHVYLGELVARHKDSIEDVLARGTEQAGAAPMPPGFEKIMPAIFEAVRGGIFGVASLDYALTWESETIWTEGRLRTLEGSGLRKFLARAGDPGDNPLIAYLPEDALMMMDFVVTPDWPGREMADFLTKALGEGAGQALLQMMGPSQLFWEVTTGRAAVSVSMAGLMGASSNMLYELKEGTDAAAVFAGFDVGELNKACETFGLPITYQLERAVATHGETELHQLSMQSSDPMLAMMLASSQTYFAAEGGHVFMVSSASPEQGIRDLIDRVRKGEKSENPHRKAMGRLGRKHNLGVTFNAGQLRMFAPMLMMVEPSVGQALAQLPEKLYISAAFTFEKGDLYWRGSWPAREIIEVVRNIQEGAASREETAPKPADEDFE